MLPSPLLVVTDRHGSARPLADTVRAVLDGGARWIWFRDRDLDQEARRDLALDCLAAVREAGACLTIGGDARLAAEIGADGVHLGGSPDPLRERPVAADPDRPLLLGVSAHTLADVRRAAEAGAGYATLSPIFATASKPGYGPALGLDALRESTGPGLPVLALGGIGPDEARGCLEAGAAGIAVMGLLMRAADPACETRRLLRALRPDR